MASRFVLVNARDVDRVHLERTASLVRFRAVARVVSVVLICGSVLLLSGNGGSETAVGLPPCCRSCFVESGEQAKEHSAPANMVFLMQPVNRYGSGRGCGCSSEFWVEIF
jgi:hypothetical protein